MAEFRKYLHPFDTLREVYSPQGHRYFSLEINRGCNRSCPPCKVPSQYNPDEELSLEEAFGVIDKLHSWSFRAGTILGGEPLAPLLTKEGLPFYAYTLALVRYSESKGIFTGVSTNGDYFSAEKAADFEKAGLDWLTFSLHTETRQGLDKLIECGRTATNKGIPSIMHILVTNQNADKFPGIAAYAAQNGLLVHATIVQEKGGSFSTKPEVSLMPSKEQQAKVFEVLLHLKKYGFVRINRDLLLKNLEYYPNSWKCDLERDYFLHIGAGGTLDVCEEVRTGLTYKDIDSLDDRRWRKSKSELAEKCSGCLYRCYYESEDPSIRVDIATLAVMAAIKAKRASLVRKWGQVAISLSKKSRPDIDWSLTLKQ